MTISLLYLHTFLSQEAPIDPETSISPISLQSSSDSQGTSFGMQTPLQVSCSSPWIKQLLRYQQWLNSLSVCSLQYSSPSSSPFLQYVSLSYGGSRSKEIYDYQGLIWWDDLASTNLFHIFIKNTCRASIHD